MTRLRRTCFDCLMHASRELVFTLVQDGEAGALASWLAAETWPFHPRVRWTHEAALASIRAGDFSGMNPTYWVDLGRDERVGIVHYRYLQDVSPDTDFRLREPYRGRGLGTRMVKWAAGHLFTTTDKHRLAGETRADNIAMRRTFHKCGWVQEAHYRRSWPTGDGGWSDSFGYAILRDEWEWRESRSVTRDDA